MLNINVLYISLIVLQFTLSNAWIFSQTSYKFLNYTNKVPVRLSGFMTAFGDFNADRTVDIFILDLTNNVQHIDVLLMAREDSADLPKRLKLIDDNKSSIRNVVTGDFNGDSFLDILMYTSDDIRGPYFVKISYGVSQNNLVTPPILINENITFKSQPLHLDWNADMIGDVFGQTNHDNSFVVFLGNKSKKFILKELPSLSDQINNAIDTLLFQFFVDLNKDGQADILLIGRKGNDLVLAGLIKSGFDFYLNTSKAIKDQMTKIGQPVIADFLFDGTLQIIIPYCSDDLCRSSKIKACILNDFSCVNANFTTTVNNIPMGFKPSDDETKRLSLTIPDIVQMSCGDIKMSGSIECLVPMYRTDSLQSMGLYKLHNHGNFRFSVVLLEGESKLFENVTQVAVFDLLENGIPDLITSSSQGDSAVITPLLQETSGDSYFLKVMVLNGLCPTAENCPRGKLPFGIPLPGVIVNYYTESISGNAQMSMVSMVSSSSYSSLMLPYAYFGLSTFSNYIEKLTVHVPSNTTLRKHTLTFIVPKTQIVIIPYPLDEPDKWSNKLFLEPFSDKKVIYVAAALLGTMFFVAIILCVLQYLEVREDKLEKMQEAQKFNFDAM